MALLSDAIFRRRFVGTPGAMGCGWYTANLARTIDRRVEALENILSVDAQKLLSTPISLIGAISGRGRFEFERRRRPDEWPAREWIETFGEAPEIVVCKSTGATYVISGPSQTRGRGKEEDDEETKNAYTEIETSNLDILARCLGSETEWIAHVRGDVWSLYYSKPVTTHDDGYDGITVVVVVPDPCYGANDPGSRRGGYRIDLKNLIEMQTFYTQRKAAGYSVKDIPPPLAYFTEFFSVGAIAVRASKIANETYPKVPDVCANDISEYGTALFGRTRNLIDDGMDRFAAARAKFAIALCASGAYVESDPMLREAAGMLVARCVSTLVCEAFRQLCGTAMGVGETQYRDITACIINASSGKIRGDNSVLRAICKAFSQIDPTNELLMFPGGHNLLDISQNTTDQPGPVTDAILIIGLAAWGKNTMDGGLINGPIDYSAVSADDLAGALHRLSLPGSGSRDGAPFWTPRLANSIAGIHAVTLALARRVRGGGTVRPDMVRVFDIDVGSGERPLWARREIQTVLQDYMRHERSNGGDVTYTSMETAAAIASVKGICGMACGTVAAECTIAVLMADIFRATGANTSRAAWRRALDACYSLRWSFVARNPSAKIEWHERAVHDGSDSGDDADDAYDDDDDDDERMSEPIDDEDLEGLAWVNSKRFRKLVGRDNAPDGWGWGSIFSSGKLSSSSSFTPSLVFPFLAPTESHFSVAVSGGGAARMSADSRVSIAAEAAGWAVDGYNKLPACVVVWAKDLDDTVHKTMSGATVTLFPTARPVEALHASCIVVSVVPCEPRHAGVFIAPPKRDEFAWARAAADVHSSELRYDQAIREAWSRALPLAASKLYAPSGHMFGDAVNIEDGIPPISDTDATSMLDIRPDVAGSGSGGGRVYEYLHSRAVGAWAPRVLTAAYAKTDPLYILKNAVDDCLYGACAVFDTATSRRDNGEGREGSSSSSSSSSSSGRLVEVHSDSTSTYHILIPAREAARFSGKKDTRDTVTVVAPSEWRDRDVIDAGQKICERWRPISAALMTPEQVAGVGTTRISRSLGADSVSADGSTRAPRQTSFFAAVANSSIALMAVCEVCFEIPLCANSCAYRGETLTRCISEWSCPGIDIPVNTDHKIADITTIIDNFVGRLGQTETESVLAPSNVADGIGGGFVGKSHEFCHVPAIVSDPIPIGSRGAKIEPGARPLALAELICLGARYCRTLRTDGKSGFSGGNFSQEGYLRGTVVVDNLVCRWFGADSALDLAAQSERFAGYRDAAYLSSLDSNAWHKQSKSFKDWKSCRYDDRSSDNSFARDIWEHITAAAGAYGKPLGINFKLQNVRGDGSCQYAAVALALRNSPRARSMGWDTLETKDIRTAVANYILVNRDDEFDKRVTILHGPSIEVFCKEIAETDAWGDELTLSGAAKAFDVNINVFSAQTPKNVAMFTYQSVRAAQAALFIALHSERHYQTLIPSFA